MDLVERDVGALDDVMHDLVVHIRERVHENVPRLYALLERAGRYLGLAVRRAEAFLVVVQRLHRDQVHDSREGIARPDRYRDRHGVRAEPLVHHPHGVFEIAPHAVHLVDEREPRYLVPVGLPPHRLRLGLDAADAAENDDQTIEHPETPFHLDGEIDVPRRVDDVDLMVVPEAGRGGGHDRDPPLPLLLHPVHHGAALVHLAHPMDLAGIEENPLGQGSLARIDVGRYPDVADHLKRKISGHQKPLLAGAS